MKKVFFILFLVLIITPILILGFLGFIPGLSTLLGTDKPRDLGIRYTEADLKSCRVKSQVKYDTSLPDNSDPVQSVQYIGKRDINTEFTAQELTATMNNQPWKYWPYKNVQLKFNTDGSGEISGILIKSKIPGYAAIIGASVEVTNFAMKFLPNDPVFYVKMRASLKDNKVDLFEPQSLQIGRLPIPLDLFLSFRGPQLIGKAFAQDIGGMTKELSQVKNKKALIINYINSRLNGHLGSFYAKKAYFKENTAYFDGTLSERISYVP